MTDKLLFPTVEQSVPSQIRFSSSELLWVSEQALRNFLNYNQSIGVKDTGKPMSERELRTIAWVDAVLGALKIKGMCDSLVVSREVVDLEPDAEH